MAYSGFLIRIGDYEISAKKIIKADSYSAYLNVQDLDSYRDANGLLHRTALGHIPVKVEFETVAMLTNKQYGDFMRNIRRNYTVAGERKVLATVYVPEIDDYVTQEMYMPDPQPTIYGTYGGIIHYNPIRVAFIGY